MTEHTCPNGHPAPALITRPCAQCSARVSYEPCSVGMAIMEAVEAVRDQAGRAHYERETPKGRMSWEACHPTVRAGWTELAFRGRP